MDNVYCRFCGADYNRQTRWGSGEHVCDSRDIEIALLEFSEMGGSPDLPSEEEYRERLAQILAWEAAGNGHIRVSHRFPLEEDSGGWGGPRPKSGGPRPNSGPLAGTIRSFRPFAWREKGATLSSSQFEFTRCNACGAIGWESLREEMLWDASRPEGEGWQDVEEVPDNPLAHAPGCENQ